MPTLALQTWVTVRSFAVVARARLADEAGEGVISTAIAVLLIAALGVVLWGVFQQVVVDVETKVDQKVTEIG